jgi:hypothetical protein
MTQEINFKAGETIQLRVKRAGVPQRVVFKMISQPSPAGPYKLLETDRQIPINELSIVAEFRYFQKANHRKIF